MGTQSFAQDRRTTLRLEEQAGALFAACLNAFHAFQGLSELSEDMRILSLNAELAAGRAGTKGIAVRALTQYTRQLVSQLNRLRDDMTELRQDTNGLSARTLRDLQRLRLIEDARRRCEAVPNDDDGARVILTATETDMRRDGSALMARMLDNTRRLSSHAARVRQVADQSAGIATNIAIEAAAAGRHESEFRTVADTMKHYIANLQTMVDQAGAAVRKADETARLLSSRLGTARAVGSPSATAAGQAA